MDPLSPEEHTEFRGQFEKILKAILKFPFIENTSGATEWLENMVRYNVLDGKQSRAKIFLLAYFNFAKAPSPGSKELAFVMAWVMEFIQAEALICDDMMDASTLRRGRACWHLVPNVGMSAVNDVLTLDKCAFMILETFFKDEPHYAELKDMLDNSIFVGCIGQNLDDRTCNKRGLLQGFTMEIYEQIVRAKTAHYGFYLPVQLAMTMAGVKSQNLIAQVGQVMMQIGRLFQIQDDFLDVFMDEGVTGKVGTDIPNRKCAWPIVAALARASKTQLKLLEENYGGNHPSQNLLVKKIFSELRIPQLYRQEEEICRGNILADIEKLSSGNAIRFLKVVLEGLFRRKG